VSWESGRWATILFIEVRTRTRLSHSPSNQAEASRRESCKGNRLKDPRVTIPGQFYQDMERLPEGENEFAKEIKARSA